MLAGVAAVEVDGNKEEPDETPRDELNGDTVLLVAEFDAPN